MLKPGRHANTSDYRYGFQGQEMDDEIKGEGNSLNYTFRMHDPRVGRFFAVDPLTYKYPWYTPYQFAGNKVLQFGELEGLEEEILTPIEKVDYRPMPALAVAPGQYQLEGTYTVIHNLVLVMPANLLADSYNASSSLVNHSYWMISGQRKYDLYKDIIYPVEESANNFYEYTTETPVKQQLKDYGNSFTKWENYEAGLELLLAKKIAVSTKVRTNYSSKNVKTQGLASTTEKAIDATPQPIILTLVFENRAHQIASSIAKKNAKNFNCVPCVENIVKELKKEGFEGNLLRIKSNNVNSNMGSRIFSKTKNDVISTNGYHYGVEVDGKVFDNIHTEGIDYEDWKNDFEIPVGGTIESVPDTGNN